MKKIVLVLSLVFGLSLVGCSNPVMMPSSMIDSYVSSQPVEEEPKVEEEVEEEKPKVITKTITYKDELKETVEEVINVDTKETIKKTYYDLYDEIIKIEYFENNEVVNEERYIYYYSYMLDWESRRFDYDEYENKDYFYSLEVDKDGKLLRAKKWAGYWGCHPISIELGDTTRYIYRDTYIGIQRKNDIILKYNENSNKYYLAVIGDNGSEYMELAFTPCDRRAI